MAAWGYEFYLPQAAMKYPLCRVQLLNKRRPRISAASETRKTSI